MEHEEELSLGLLVRALDAQTGPRERKFRYSVESELKNEPGQCCVGARHAHREPKKIRYGVESELQE